MNERRPAGIVSMPREVLHLLLELPGEADMETLRAAGDAGGISLLDAFAQRSAEIGTGDLADLPVEEFQARVAEFFQWCGWGDTTVFTSADSLIQVTIHDCWETKHRYATQAGCHLTTGLLHGFFAALAGYELGVMELQCAGLGSGGSCRFVISTPEMVDSIYADLGSRASFGE